VNADQFQRQPPPHYDSGEDDELDPEEHDPVVMGNHTALKFLFAGGVAGAGMLFVNC
jgi:solute carrier family 25 phosphate transporter 23/24/25/41